MYDLESGVSPNEGCTGSLHTHKKPGWTSKRIGFGGAGIKGSSRSGSPPVPAQPSPALRPCPSLPCPPGCGAGRGAGAGLGSSAPHGRCPPAPPRAPLLRETWQRPRCRALRRERRRLRERIRRALDGKGEATAGPQRCRGEQPGSAERGTRVGAARTEPLCPLILVAGLLSPLSPGTRCGCSLPVPPHPSKFLQRLRAPRSRLRSPSVPSPAGLGRGGCTGTRHTLCPGRGGQAGPGGRNAGVAGGQRARDGRRFARGAQERGRMRSLRSGQGAAAALFRAGVNGGVSRRGQGGSFPRLSACPAEGSFPWACPSPGESALGTGGIVPRGAALSRLERGCPG